MLHHIQQCSFATLALLLVIFNGLNSWTRNASENTVECVTVDSREWHTQLKPVIRCRFVMVFLALSWEKKKKERKRKENNTTRSSWKAVPGGAVVNHKKNLAKGKSLAGRPQILIATIWAGWLLPPSQWVSWSWDKCLSVRESVGFPNTNMAFPSDSLAGAKWNRWKYVFDTLWKEKQREASWAGVCFT